MSTLFADWRTIIEWSEEDRYCWHLGYGMVIIGLNDVFLIDKALKPRGITCGRD